MLTQVIDPGSDVLGFVPGWIRALGRRVERLYVLAGRVVPCDLGPNVEVMSLGKEEGKGRLTRLARFFLGIKHAVSRRGADVIFAHMNPEYVIAAAPVSRAPVVLWYTHTAVTKKLKLAVRLARLVVTATGESFGVCADATPEQGRVFEDRGVYPPVSEAFRDPGRGRADKLPGGLLIGKNVGHAAGGFERHLDSASF